MTLDKTEVPLHIPQPQQVPDPVPVDYIDVSKAEGDQPRYRLQPHADGGKPIGASMILEREGAQALIQHLERILRDPIAD